MQLLTAGKSNVTALAFAPTGTGLVAVCVNHVPLWWDLPAAGSPVPLTDKAVYSCGSFAFSPDASVVSWIADRQRVERDRRAGAARVVAAGPDSLVSDQIVCGPDARLVVLTAESRDEFHLRALAPGAGGGWAVAWHVSLAGITGWGLAGSPRSERFFVWEVPLTREGPARRFVARSALSGEVLAETPAPLNYAGGFRAKSDGSALVAFKNSSLYYWQPGEELERVRTGTLTHYRDLAFHPDGHHLLTGNNDTTARLIDTRTWQVVRQYTWAVGQLGAVAISPDGQLAAAGGAKGRVVVWDLDI
ncbi:WD40 repeat domain-containing protein [Frigoriglobus tundricola]|uniref:High-affnity carbon uptake protein Hat/HatR n=1 Tax=Frigoriglobus tundricola TaxID=2774151 RepID=A0A6M5YRE4_9BACT|nr:hypothetical protein [Frigoriglobus tundricola]QJW96519.1 High-affnity carbon uptake protein Hat/HatR [Frigoriglobus tundricola]